MGEAALSGVLEAIYGAAGDPGAWEPALAAVRAWTGSDVGHLFIWDSAVATAPFSVSAGRSRDAERAYVEHYGAIDPRRELGDRMPVGEAWPCHAFFDDAFAARHELFQDFLRPNDLRYMAAANLVKGAGRAAIFAVLRSRGRGVYAPADMARVQLLVPHLQQAVRLQHRLALLGAERDAASQALDRLPFALALVASDGGVRTINGRMQRLAAAADGLVIRRNRLIATHYVADERLRRLVSDAAGTGFGRSLGRGGFLRLDRESGRQALIASVTPAPARLAAVVGNEQPAAAVFVLDPEERRRTPATMLHELFGLTPAESRLAVALAHGARLEDAAETLGVSKNTARSQLRAVFAKTGTTRQADLVRLLQLPFQLDAA